ncbi:uncharacterized protein SPPG_06532 [Spizellomyces punctatus DAOM BR117]|uniref:C2H2-type domain-containing protein n=1 Tax=Spizellomyces punctatus (strain DAOM BR117) TaxID=645134 RepID=A0A0L0HB77_SPIPD|nr:uncharacterized protein SPPG_06532 [Spizellomyces punctatus DAOM BR117]KNC98124.1 hypothetical protein SPPG_06532 [Spizellomyces punctatus DAOM BR117]|eukprot:XP_016606164.1 hypothetical protein SPPG_06532 [Spizellomyces punctatus DAOM BR117]
MKPMRSSPEAVAGDGQKLGHTSPKLFKCPEPDCGKAFTRRFNLQSHELVHSNLRPFKCELCNRTFRRKFDQRRHMQSVHMETGSKPYTCDLCGLGFTRSDTLRRHRSLEAMRKRYEKRESSREHSVGTDGETLESGSNNEDDENEIKYEDMGNLHRHHQSYYPYGPDPSYHNTGHMPWVGPSYLPSLSLPPPTHHYPVAPPRPRPPPPPPPPQLPSLSSSLQILPHLPSRRHLSPPSPSPSPHQTPNPKFPQLPSFLSAVQPSIPNQIRLPPPPATVPKHQGSRDLSRYHLSSSSSAPVSPRSQVPNRWHGMWR